MAVRMFIDYNDPRNRPYKVPIDGIVKGYTFNRMKKWTENWDDPMASIRRSSRYAFLYRQHYNYLMGCITKKDRAEGVRYLVDGLKDCIQMFENIQTGMDPKEKMYKSFTWEAKVTFFSFFDFCKPKKEVL